MCHIHAYGVSLFISVVFFLGRDNDLTSCPFVSHLSLSLPFPSLFLPHSLLQISLGTLTGKPSKGGAHDGAGKCGYIYYVIMVI
jgi:hypothetical protein